MTNPMPTPNIPDEVVENLSMLAGKYIDGSGTCNTCNGYGMIGGHFGQTPEQYEEYAEPCPDCNESLQATTLPNPSID